MKTILYPLTFLAFLLVFQNRIEAQDIVGIWKTIDDRTDQPTSHVRIYKHNGAYFGKVVAMLRDDPSSLCEECTGDKKDKPIMHMVILRDLVAEDGAWTGGRILDPENGKEYKCNIHLESEHALVLRGYIGAPLFGRSQNWIRVE